MFLLLPITVSAQNAELPDPICTTIVNKMMESKKLENMFQKEAIVKLQSKFLNEIQLVTAYSTTSRNEIERQRLLFDLFRDHNCDTNMLNNYIKSF